MRNLLQIPYTPDLTGVTRLVAAKVTADGTRLTIERIETVGPGHVVATVRAITPVDRIKLKFKVPPVRTVDIVSVSIPWDRPDPDAKKKPGLEEIIVVTDQPSLPDEVMGNELCIPYYLPLTAGLSEEARQHLRDLAHKVLVHHWRSCGNRGHNVAGRQRGQVHFPLEVMKHLTVNTMASGAMHDRLHDVGINYFRSPPGDVWSSPFIWSTFVYKNGSLMKPWIGPSGPCDDFVGGRKHTLTSSLNGLALLGAEV